eukprot:scaffold22397_cov19-Tisochrysis_lutea.AAC.3
MLGAHTRSSKPVPVECPLFVKNGKGTCFEHPCALVTVKGDGSAGKAFVSMRNFEETKCKCS